MSKLRVNTLGTTDDSFNINVKDLSYVGGVVGEFRNLKIVALNGALTATLTADEVITQTALGGRQYKLANFNKTINLATTGINGMDIGSPPVNGFIALYAMYNPSTLSMGLLAVNATSVVVPETYGGTNTPPGYSASTLVSILPIVGSTFKRATQVGRKVSILPTVVFTGTTDQTSTITPLDAAAPKNTRLCDFDLTIISSNAVNNSVFVATTSDKIGYRRIQSSSSVAIGPASEVAVIDNIVYFTSSGNGGTTTCALVVVAYTF